MLNPYEPPQTIDTPPLPPATEQTHLEQVSFRHLSEIAWSFALPGQIMIVALLVSVVLVGVTWQFYLPGNNPNWVTIVMLGCGSIIAVLGCWAGFMSSVAYSSLTEHLEVPPSPSKRERVMMAIYSIGATYSITPIILVSRGQLTWAKLFPLSLLCYLLALFWYVSKQHALLTTFLRSFLPQGMDRQSSRELTRISLVGALVVLSGLFVMILESSPGLIAWGWLMLALVGAIVYAVPITYAYHQLARELDKLWP